MNKYKDETMDGFDLFIGLITLLFSVISILGIIIWIIWEWNLFSDEKDQRLYFEENLDLETGWIKKINIIDFTLDISNQRVVQKIISPIAPLKKKRIKDIDEIVWDFFSSFFKPSEEELRSQFLDCSMYANSNLKSVDEKNCKKISKLYNKKNNPELNKAFLEVEKTISSKERLLSEIKNCTIKSFDDWICRDNWYSSNLEGNKPNFIGKRNRKWLLPPEFVVKIYNWKSGMFFQTIRCGQVCLISTRSEEPEIMKNFRKMMENEEKYNN